VRELFRRLATLAALRVVNAALDVANAALRDPDAGRGRTAGGPHQPKLESVMALLPRPSLDGLEATCRERMAAVVKHGPARGFDTGRVRAALLAQCDAALDLYNLAATASDDTEELVP
jgi:hypothetical protein